MLEIITLRTLEEIPGELVQELLRSFRDDSEIRLELYRRVKVSSDLSVHLHREVARDEPRRSDLGLRLAAALRDHGRVSHTVWERADREMKQP